MAETVEWNEEFNDGTGGGGGNNDGNRIPFMKLVSGGAPAVVRLIGKPVLFRRFVNKTASGFRNAICSEDSTIGDKYDIKKNVRFAVHLIDRADGVLKLFEFGVTIYNVFKSYKDMTGNMPGGPDGADFSITKTGSGLQTKYKTQKVGSGSPFTTEEKQIIISAGNIQGLESDLKNRFKALPDDQIENILFGDGSPVSAAVEQPQQAQTVTQSSTVEAPAENIAPVETGGDDLDF
jgi:hypothetical protein